MNNAQNLYENLIKSTFEFLEKAKNDKNFCSQAISKIKFLQEGGVQIETVLSSDGLNIMSVAAKNNLIEILEFCHNSGVDLNASTKNINPLLIAIAEQNIDAFNFLIDKTNVNQTVGNNVSALHIAFERGNVHFINSLISHGANVNHRRDDGVNCLKISAQTNQPIQAVQILLDASFDIHAKDKDGYNSLMDMVNYQNIDIVKLLINKGARVNDQANNGATALLIASYKGNLPIVECLLKSGADIDLPDNERVTPIMSAAAFGHLPVVKFLYDKGANKDTEDCRNEHVEEYAAKSNNPEVLSFLKEMKQQERKKAVEKFVNSSKGRELS